ncbi:MAG TPA: adenylate/guanylate cyclase domain-containing protein [Chitinophagaceae bacterium]|nr:adenylate/guanylate cyclase domain-containing protein [Chitinophagaceae bacterium]HRA10788.1 adenylate/guanylate cyclase domain-containing protein [Chitinophagaceae bacterium]
MPDHSHQLAAILFADVVGYTAMMQEDEEDAVGKINRFRHSLETIAEELNGKIIQYYGDGALLLFQSSTDAAEFAKVLQMEINEPPVIPVRIGIHMGEVLLQKGNVFGDVVNIASRIQALAPPGGIYVSEIVYQNIANKKGLESVFIKQEKLKNVNDPVRIFEVLTSYSKPIIVPVALKPLEKIVEENSIAVLPFSNMSSDMEQEYFSDGLTEDIITQLSKIKALKVVSRTSVMQYKKNPKSIKEIGKELGVAVILEGSVQRSSNKVRITAQLIDAATDEHLWADSFDRSVKDIFVIQREVAISIATVLNKKLSKKEVENLDDAPSVDVQAYDLYLRGKFLVEKRNKTDLLIARELFQQALKKAKDFAPAISGLANTYLLSSYRGYEDPDIMLPLAKKQIDIALTIEPSAAETHAAMGYWFHQTFKWKEAEKSYRKSIQLNPNQSNVYLWLAILLEGKSEKDLANEIYIKGMEINPEWEYLMQSRVKALMNTGNHEEAIKLQKHLIDKATFDLVLRSKRYAELSRLYWSVNNKDEAIQMATKAKDNGLLRFYKDGDNSFLVREVNEQYNVLRKSGDYISEFWMGLAYANAGSKDKALTCFGNAVVLKEAAVTLLLIDHYEFLNLKYLNFIQLKRSIKALINF